MIITCKNCSTSFNLSDELVSDSGIKVRCSKCHYVFQVYSPHAQKDNDDQQNGVSAQLQEEKAGEWDTGEKMSHSGLFENSRDDEDDFLLGGDEDADDDIDLSEIDKMLQEDEAKITQHVSDFQKLESRKDHDDFDFEFGDLEELFAEEDDLDDLGKNEDLSSFDLEADVDMSSAKDSAEEIDLSELDDFFKEDQEWQESFSEMDTGLDDSGIESAEKGKTILEPPGPEDLEKGDHAEAVDDIDFSELDQLFKEDDDESMELTKDEAADLEFDLDLETENEAGAGEVAEKEDEAADLEFDLDLEMDDEAGAGEVAEKEDEAADLEFDLDLEMDDEAGAGEVAEKEDEAADLEFDLDLEMDDEAGAGEVAEKEDEAADLEFDLDLEMDDEAGAGEVAEKEDEAADLEFDLDLEMDDEAGAGEVAEKEDEAADLEFDLDLETEDEAGVEDVTEKEDETAELDFEFDLEDSEKTVGKTSSDEEFDLSDLEQIIDLEEETSAEAKSPALDEKDFEFDFALEPDDEKGLAPEVILEGEDVEIDISDQDADSDFAAHEKDHGYEQELYDEKALEARLRENDEYELEENDEKFKEVFETVTLTGHAHQEEKEESMVTEKEEKQKSRIGKPVVVILVLLLLAAAGYGAFTVVNMMGIQLPFVGDYLKSTSPDPGNLKMTISDLDSRFIDNQNKGKMFIITGMVKNEYPEPRSFVKITGKLYQSARQLSHNEQVYAGNMITDLELRSLDPEVIKTRLQNRFGQNRTNVNIQPGQSIPFIIVFSDLTRTLEEFTVEIESSSPS